LYFFSDGIYILVFYIFKYRRNVVKDNLKFAFPEKTEKERMIITKKVYHNLIDTFFETIKMLSASKKTMLKRFTGNWEFINQYKSSGKSIQIHSGHNFNWEWCNTSCPIKLQFPFLAVYMPVNNKIFDRLFYKLRSRFGSIMLRAGHMREDFQPYRDKQYILVLAADQNPGHPGNGWWFKFFGRPTPFVKGPAKGAITNNAVVVFAFIHKFRRGYYEAVFSLGEENPSVLTEQELTRKFAQYLEDVIRKYPDMWLWSHRRWKWEWKEEYSPVI
jgi:KDO2-lipid IV(A) lauroyltransferase